MASLVGGFQEGYYSARDYQNGSNYEQDPYATGGMEPVYDEFGYEVDNGSEQYVDPSAAYDDGSGYEPVPQQLFPSKPVSLMSGMASEFTEDYSLDTFEGFASPNAGRGRAAVRSRGPRFLSASRARAPVPRPRAPLPVPGAYEYDAGVPSIAPAPAPRARLMRPGMAAPRARDPAALMGMGGMPRSGMGPSPLSMLRGTIGGGAPMPRGGLSRGRSGFPVRGAGRSGIPKQFGVAFGAVKKRGTWKFRDVLSRPWVTDTLRKTALSRQKLLLEIKAMEKEEGKEEEVEDKLEEYYSLWKAFSAELDAAREVYQKNHPDSPMAKPWTLDPWVDENLARATNIRDDLRAAAIASVANESDFKDAKEYPMYVVQRDLVSAMTLAAKMEWIGRHPEEDYVKIKVDMVGGQGVEPDTEDEDEDDAKNIK